MIPSEFTERWAEYIKQIEFENDLIKLLQSTAIISSIIGILVGAFTTVFFFQAVVL